MAERVLVTGGTGKTGRLLVEQLGRRRVEARVGTRRPSGPGQVRFDWGDPSTFGPALDGVDAIYLVAPTEPITFRSRSRSSRRRSRAASVRWCC